MESALCLHSCPPHFRLPSTRDATRATRPDIGFRNSSLFVSNGSMNCSLGRVLHPVTRKLDGFSRPSTYKKGNNYATRATRAMFLPFNGRNSLKSLLEVTLYLATNEHPNACRVVSDMPLGRMPEPPSVKIEAMEKMKSGESDEALKIMREAYQNTTKQNPHDAYPIGMALVEILISQGKYCEALACKCLEDEHFAETDGRISLYKAIIYTMLNELEKAQKCWEDYTNVVAGGYDIDIKEPCL